MRRAIAIAQEEQAHSCIAAWLDIRQ